MRASWEADFLSPVAHFCSCGALIPRPGKCGRCLDAELAAERPTRPLAPVGPWPHDPDPGAPPIPEKPKPGEPKPQKDDE